LYAKIGISLKRISKNLKRRSAIARMRKGDIILASPRTSRLSLIAFMYRLFLKSQYTHTMLYIGKGKVIHSTGKKGVVISKVPGKVHRKEKYSIFRVKNMEAEDRKKVVEQALKWKDKKLDHAGLISNIPARLLGLSKPLIRWERNRIWCSKLVYDAYKTIGIELVIQEKAENITSEDLHQSQILRKIKS
jgi:cell wall-associated NlpC family hydrolase